MDHQVSRPQLGPIVRIDKRSAAGTDHLVLIGHDPRDRFTFDRPKGDLAAFAEDLGDGPAGHLLDVAVGIDKRQPQPPRDIAPKGGLTTAAEADQDQVIHSPLDTTGNC